MLKLSDLGHAEFHSRDSSTGINAITRTYYGTYQASEFETIGKTSQVSGIWALGCIYLEITTWYLGYKEAYDGFSDALLTQSSFVDQLSEDTFYHIVKTPYYGIRAVIKEEVIEVSTDPLAIFHGGLLFGRIFVFFP